LNRIAHWLLGPFSLDFYDQQSSFRKSEQGRTAESTRPEGQEKRTPRALEYHRSCQIDKGIQDDLKINVLVGLRILHSYLIENFAFLFILAVGFAYGLEQKQHFNFLL